MTAISVKGVSHTFETRRAKLRALEDIDLEIDENEFVTLVGDRKSTRLNSSHRT